MLKHRLGTLSLSSADRQAVLDVLHSNWLSPGPKVKEFEQAFSAFHSQSYGVMVNSGTDALRVALAALKEKYGWKDGDTVLVPSVTFVATVNVVLQLNLRPVLVDVDPVEFEISAYQLSSRFLPPRTRCVIPVHLAGNPCDIPGLKLVAEGLGLKVLEDCCEAVGIEWIAKAEVTAFSFYAAHILTTGVGGMSTTNDKDLRDLMWSYANHGRRETGKFAFPRIGYSSRATEVEAALGLTQLPHLRAAIKKRRRNAFYLSRHLKAIDALQVHFFPASACMFFPIVLKEGSREPLLEHLERSGIEVRTLLPLTNQPCYRGLWNENDYPVAKRLNAQGFYIGCHQDMTQGDLDEIISAFNIYFKRTPQDHMGQTVEVPKPSSGDLSYQAPPERN